MILLTVALVTAVMLPVYCDTQGWLLHRSQHESDVLLGLFDRVYNDLVVYSVQNLHKKMVTLQSNTIMQVGLLSRRC